jgi:hypothetical protein
MSDRLDLVSEYMKAKAQLEKAEAYMDAVKFQLKEYGTFSEGGAVVEVSVVCRETVSLKELKDLRPELIKDLRDAGIIKKSESERLSVKIKEEQERPF